MRPTLQAKVDRPFFAIEHNKLLKTVKLLSSVVNSETSEWAPVLSVSHKVPFLVHYSSL